MTTTERETRPHVADIIYAIARDRYTFAQSPTGIIAMEIGQDWPVAIPLGDLRPRLAAVFQADPEHGGRVPSRSAVTNALDAIEGAALNEELPERDPQPRVARAGQARLIVDLADGTGRACMVTPRGVTIDHAPTRTSVCFARTSAMGALPEPDLTADPAALPGLLSSLVNMDDTAIRLTIAWLVAALVPDIAHPVLILRGEQGTAKSTAARIVTRIIDPGPAPLRQPPKDVDAWTTSASASWVVCLDNVSSLRDDVSDALCRAVTGDGLVKRRLYSDNGAYVINMRRAVMMTTIEAGAARGDLAERSLALTLLPVGDRRISERDIEALFAEAHPELLGALLTLASRVLAVLPQTHLAHAPRMADFAQIAAAIDTVYEWEGATLTAYLEGLAATNEDVLESNPVAQQLLAYLDEHGAFEGSAGDLLNALNARFEDTSRPLRWPTTPRGITGVLTRLNPALRGVGWEFVQLGRMKHRRTIAVRPCTVPE